MVSRLKRGGLGCETQSYNKVIFKFTAPETRCVRWRRGGEMRRGVGPLEGVEVGHAAVICLAICMADHRTPDACGLISLGSSMAESIGDTPGQQRASKNERSMVMSSQQEDVHSNGDREGAKGHLMGYEQATSLHHYCLYLPPISAQREHAAGINHR